MYSHSYSTYIHTQNTFMALTSVMKAFLRVLNFIDEQHSLSLLQFAEVQATYLQQA